MHYAGIDAGASGSRLVAQTHDGDSTPVLHGSGANVLREGLHQTAQQLSSLLMESQKQHPRGRYDAVVAGVAGAGERELQRALTHKIRDSLGHTAPRILEITHDGVIALEAAFPAASGILLISGTGSSILARTHSGALVRAGGWGYLIGDEGSGYAIGRDGVAAAAHAADGGPPTALTISLNNAIGTSAREKLLGVVYQQRWPLQEMAPHVLEASQDGDPVARQIVVTATQALARQAHWLLQRTPDIALQLCFAGGLSHSAHYCTLLTRALKAALPDIRVSRLAQPSVHGALRLARQLAQGTITPDQLRVTDSADDQ